MQDGKVKEFLKLLQEVSCKGFQEREVFADFCKMAGKAIRERFGGVMMETMTADSIDDKVNSGDETAILPAVRICHAKRYIMKMEDFLGREVGHNSLCTRRCSGYNPDCEYWRKEYGTEQTD